MESAIIFATARSESLRPQTKNWLIRHGWPKPQLLMRKLSDERPDHEIKAEFYRQQISPNYEVLFALEDRPSVAQMWCSLGLTCLQVADGR